MRVAAIQFAPKFGDVAANAFVIAGYLEDVARHDVAFAVFPECALHGYVYESLDESLRVAVTPHGNEIEAIRRAVAETGVAAAFGFIERRPSADVSNTLLIVQPDGRESVYRKTHLPQLGLDRWAAAGVEMSPIVELDGVRFGFAICYDLRFPEVTRSLALAGVDAIVVPTNWPERYEATAEHAARTRAWENRVWLVAANRVGVERDTRFIGRSVIVDPFGAVVAQAGDSEPEVILAEVDPVAARSKTLPGHGGELFDFFSSRRPELYERIVEPLQQTLMQPCERGGVRTR